MRARTSIADPFGGGEVTAGGREVAAGGKEVAARGGQVRARSSIAASRLASPEMKTDSMIEAGR